MTLSYILDKAGWATATIAHDALRREMTVSYLSDSLAEMTQAAICLLEGSDSVRFFLRMSQESIAALLTVSQIPMLRFGFCGLTTVQIFQTRAALKFSTALAPLRVFLAKYCRVCRDYSTSMALKDTSKNGLSMIFHWKDLSVCAD
jgi:hypothetical protein